MFNNQIFGETTQLENGQLSSCVHHFIGKKSGKYSYRFLIVACSKNNVILKILICSF